jgi:geranylgeranyl pyrophosphate synthase
MAQEYGDKAIKALQQIPASPLRDILENVIAFTINREF